MRLNLLSSGDVARALEFYEGLLNFIRIEADEGYARLRAPDAETTIGLHAAQGASGPPWDDGIGLYLEVDDVDGVRIVCSDTAANAPKR